MGACVFCRIITGEEEASVVYEDGICLVLMDLMPVNEGHLLVVPRAHAELVPDLVAPDRAHVMEVGVRAAGALRRSEVRCEGINFWIADGEAAGQEVPHVHLHVLPRFGGDGFRLVKEGGWASPQERAVLDTTAERVRSVWT